MVLVLVLVLVFHIFFASQPNSPHLDALGKISPTCKLEPHIALMTSPICAVVNSPKSTPSCNRPQSQCYVALPAIMRVPHFFHSLSNIVFVQRCAQCAALRE